MLVDFTLSFNSSLTWFHSTNADFKTYVKSAYPGLTDAQVDQIATLYPSDITQGSPFGTGILNAITPQYKRLAALSGDAILQAPRRWMLQNTVATNPNIWVFRKSSFRSEDVSSNSFIVRSQQAV